MKIFFTILCFIPLTALANPLSHTKWVDESASKCPTAIFFGVKKYIFLNPCYARGSDGVVEKGTYAVSGNTLSLANRRSTAPDNFEFIPRDINRIPVISLSKDRLVVSIGGTTRNFRRVIRMPSHKDRNKEINTPKKQPINYSPSGVDTPNTHDTYF